MCFSCSAVGAQLGGAVGCCCLQHLLRVIDELDAENRQLLRRVCPSCIGAALRSHLPDRRSPVAPAAKVMESETQQPAPATSAGDDEVRAVLEVGHWPTLPSLAFGLWWG